MENQIEIKRSVQDFYAEINDVMSKRIDKIASSRAKQLDTVIENSAPKWYLYLCRYKFLRLALRLLMEFKIEYTDFPNSRGCNVYKRVLFRKWHLIKKISFKDLVLNN